jgi:hypothetical protein
MRKIVIRWCLLALSLPFALPLQAQLNAPALKSLSDLDNCLNRFGPDLCYQSLSDYAKKSPKEMLAIAKAARLNFQHWAALSFFEQALGRAPSNAQCADRDLELAVISGLGRPVGMAGQDVAVRVLSGPCFSSLQKPVESAISGDSDEGYFRKAGCPVLKSKNIDSPACAARTAQTTPVTVTEKLPTVDLASVKFDLIKVYAGPEGERVSMAELSDSPGVFLIRFDGVRGPFNARTLVHLESTESNQRSDFWTEHDGRRWASVVRQGGSYPRYAFQVPGMRDLIVMSYSERESKAAKPENLRK